MAISTILFAVIPAALGWMFIGGAVALVLQDDLSLKSRWYQVAILLGGIISLAVFITFQFAKMLGSLCYYRV